MLLHIIELLFLFLTGALTGWVIEFFFRRFYGPSKRWVNPGFLSGPYLPLYGSGVVILYLVSGLSISVWLKIPVFAVVTTLIEYITGLFFLKFYNMRLWDYRDEKFQLQGLICLRFSFFWTILSMLFYLIIYPFFTRQVMFIFQHLEVSLFIGMFCGIMAVDVFNSFDLLNRMKKVATNFNDGKIAINYELLKEELSDRVEELSEELSEKVGQAANQLETATDRLKIKRIRPTFLRPFRGDYNMKQQVIGHLERLKNDKNRSVIKKIRKSDS